MSKWDPKPNESPEAYVERVGGWDDSNNQMMLVLQTHFELSRENAKNISLCSSTFWRHFYRVKLDELHLRGGSREQAMRFIQRSNTDMGIGKPILSDAQIDDLLAELGHWGNQ